MRTQQYRLDGEPINIHSVEDLQDLDLFEEWWRSAHVMGPLGVDSETEGLATYSGDRIRMVQFGDAYTGWCIPVEDYTGNQYAGEFRNTVVKTLRNTPFMVLHNASFDLQVFDKNFGLKMEELWPRVQDTGILAHLIEPRGMDENMITFNKDTPEEYKKPNPDGPFGHGLDTCIEKYISKPAADEVKKLMARLARENKTTKAVIFKTIDIDHPEFNLYSGMDPVFTVRLYKKLNPLVPQVSRNLIPYEHKIAEVCSYIQRQGFERDEEYCQALSDQMKADEVEAKWHADTYFDVQSVNSVQQIVEVLTEDFGMHGEKDCPGSNCNLPHFTYTKKGATQVNAELLEQLSTANPEPGSLDHLANAVVEAKRKNKWRTSWVDKFLENADDRGRVHASFNPLRARTARMSITGIPAQTLPSHDWIVRRCFRADHGHVQASIDYDAQELRVLAALSQDANMIRAFANNLDLHQVTADAAGVSRGVGKMAGFLTIYGGGAGKLSANAGISLDAARDVLKKFFQTYPQVAEYKKYMQRVAEQDGYVITPVGRVIPVDEWRSYAAINYMIQSTSRDITMRGLLALHDNGFTPFVRLVIHDEVLMSFPEEFAPWATAETGRLMGTEFRGVNISASGEIGGRSWGSLYSCNITQTCGLPKHKDTQPCEDSDWARWKAAA